MTAGRDLPTRAAVSSCVSRVQILPLQVLDQRQLHHRAVVGLEDQHRHLGESGLPRGTPAALTGDDLVVAVARGADGQRLDDAVLADRFRKLGKLLLVEILTRLQRIRLYALDWQRMRLGLRLRQIAQQRAETAAQSFLLFAHSFLLRISSARLR